MDITDRKHAETALCEREQALRASEQQFRSVLENYLMPILDTPEAPGVGNWQWLESALCP
jgi:hypothetical protein